MLHTLNILVDRKMSYVTDIDNVDYRAERTQSLRTNIFHLKSFKQFVDFKKQEDDS